jgi:hypothetical protein
MKKIKIIQLGLILIIAPILLSSCATTHPNNIGIAVVTMVTEPVAVGPSTSTGEMKVGRSTAMNVLGIVVIGDCGINAAAQNGNIKVIKSVDHKVMNILGLFGQVETIVYGE